jgi:DNA invertase Pin-like site-specific DNA recombinase
MSTHTNNGKPRRFATLIRVSTEKQAKQGESLRTQAEQIALAVETLDGTITARYDGQEHATAGFERTRLDRLLADAVKPQRAFDAVMIADPSRWSRDKDTNETGLDILRDAKVHFYVLTSEYDLYDPQDRLILGINSTIGAYHARVQKQKSLLNRIARAKRNIPTAGKLPFGRTWSAEAGWGIDKKKQDLIIDVADRYLAGEALPKLAREYNVNHSNLCKVLREQCGVELEYKFAAPDLNINTIVPLTMPRLLPDSTIRRVQARLKANRTYLHRPPRSVHAYLLSGRIFCGVCGYTMCGQLNHNGHRYYRHAHAPRDRVCPLRPRPWVPAAKIERAVLQELFALFGNRVEIERAVKAAIPDCDKLLKRQGRLEEELAKIDRRRQNFLDLITRDALTVDQAEKQLKDLKQRAHQLGTERDGIKAQLAELPDPAAFDAWVERTNDIMGRTYTALDDDGNPVERPREALILMTPDPERPGIVDGIEVNHPSEIDHAFERDRDGLQRRALLDSCFGDPIADRLESTLSQPAAPPTARSSSALNCGAVSSGALRRVLWIDQAQPFLDATAAHALFHLRRDVLEVHPRGDVEGQVVRVRLHD